MKHYFKITGLVINGTEATGQIETLDGGAVGVVIKDEPRKPRPLSTADKVRVAINTFNDTFTCQELRKKVNQLFGMSKSDHYLSGNIQPLLRKGEVAAVDRDGKIHLYKKTLRLRLPSTVAA